AMYPAGFVLAQLATAMVIIAALARGPISRLLGLRPLKWVGERSYGIYLFHWPLVALLRPRVDVSWSPLVASIVTIAAATALGALSFALVERPLLRPRAIAWRPSVVGWSAAAIATIAVI